MKVKNLASNFTHRCQYQEITIDVVSAFEWHPGEIDSIALTLLDHWDDNGINVDPICGYDQLFHSLPHV